MPSKSAENRADPAARRVHRKRPEAAPGPGKLSIVYKSTGELVPYAQNARTHSAEQIAIIAASIKAFGFTNPVLIDEQSEIIAGHGRLLAAASLALDQVPAIIIAGLTKTEKRALRLADNRIALSSGWDEELLRAEFTLLGADGFDLALTGFDMTEIERFSAADLMDPTDGSGQTRLESQDTLAWGKSKVPLTAEETDMLNKAFVKHLDLHGVAFGFVREIMGRGDLRS